MTTKSPSFIAVVLTIGGSKYAVEFPTMTDMYAWEDTHPEVEVVTAMPLVSRNYAEVVSA